MDWRHYRYFEDHLQEGPVPRIDEESVGKVVSLNIRIRICIYDLLESGTQSRAGFHDSLQMTEDRGW